MLLQNILVAVIVFACTLYAAWLLTPARPRLRAAHWILRNTPEKGNKPGLMRKVALKLAQKATQRLGKACGGCSPDGKE
jgi:hypothetical protein